MSCLDCKVPPNRNKSSVRRTFSLGPKFAKSDGSLESSASLVHEMRAHLVAASPSRGYQVPVGRSETDYLGSRTQLLGRRDGLGVS